MSGIFEAYLGGGARSFFGAHYAEPEDRLRAVEAAAARPLAPEIAAVLEAQNARLPASSARDAHLAALRAGAPAVVTGQQMGLFLGPLFTLYKAATAVRAARALAEESGRPVVPVFWLQTEDHDLPEIAECHVPCAEGPPLALRLPASAAERSSVAHCRLPRALDPCLEQMRAEIAHLPHGARHMETLARHYRPGAGWAGAFAGLLAELFAEEGLLLIDPRDAALARLAAPVHRRAFEQAQALADALAERGRALEAAGYTPGVHVRPGAPLCFFHPQGAAGPRHRLVPTEGGFGEAGAHGVHTAAELLAALDREPLCFSSSALLRPIVQDSLLPTAAYVGGPAEVAYFAQLPPLYAAFGFPPPLVVPRARLRIVEDRTLRLLARLGLTPADAARSEDELLAATPPGEASPLDDLPAVLVQPFTAALERVRPRLEAAGPGLAAAAEKTRAAVEHAVARLTEKVDKARRYGDEERVRDVRRLQHLLHPNGVPQERCHGISYYAARYGERGFVDAMLAAIVPFDAEVRDLPLSDTHPAEPCEGRR